MTFHGKILESIKTALVADDMKSLIELLEYQEEEMDLFADLVRQWIQDGVATREDRANLKKGWRIVAGIRFLLTLRGELPGDPFA